MTPPGEEGAPLVLDRDGVPVGLHQWGTLKITGAIIDAARDEMAQHGRGRKEVSRFETFSLDMPWENDGERTFGETLVDPRAHLGYEQVEEHATLLSLRDRLEPKEWDILTRYADGQTLKSIGEDVYGVSESRICQLMGKIRAKSIRILAAAAAEADSEGRVVVPVLTPLEREMAQEADWLVVLEAGEIREQQRIAKNRERYEARLQRLAGEQGA